MEDEMNKFQEMLNNKSFINSFEEKIRYFSSFLSTKYMFISLFNKICEISKHKNSNYNLFISNIISKSYNEKIITKDDLLKISNHIISNRKFESFFEIMHRTQVPDLFNQLKSIKLSKLDKINIRKIFSLNPKYIKTILSLDSNIY